MAENSPARSGRRRRPRRWRWALMIVALVLAVFAVATGRLFVWPAAAMPGRVDAVVMMAGPYERVDAAVRVARIHRAEFLAISRGHEGYGGPCPPPIPRVRLLCFDPDPATTQGEAEYAGRLARRFHWRSIMLVTITPQEWRARERMSRCFGGSVYTASRGIPWYAWPYQIAYEWGATVKMLIVQTGC